MNFQTEKKLVQKFYRAIETSENQEIASVFNEYCSDKLLWRGFHPFNMIRGSEEVSKTFWQPFLKSIKKCQREKISSLRALMKFKDMRVFGLYQWDT